MNLKRLIWNYSQNIEENAQVFTPKSEIELQQLFFRATQEKKTVALRSGGMSFDTQSMGAQWIISVEEFKHLSIDPVKKTLRVGTGASWRHILAQCLEHNLIPGVLVSTGSATPGGTLANNAHHRFSMLQGKEGQFVESFRMVTPRGDILVCSRSQNTPLFHAVIGGLGWLGAVTEVTYQLTDAHQCEWVATESFPLDHQSKAFELLRPENIPSPWMGTYALLRPSQNHFKAVLLRSRYVPLAQKPNGPPMNIYTAWNWKRFIFDFCAASLSAMNRLMWWVSFQLYFGRPRSFANRLADYSFFFDGHTRSAQLARRLGIRFYAFQHAYGLPPQQASAFIEQAHLRWSQMGLTPSMLDAIFLPKEKEPFLMSSCSDQEAVVFTVTYQYLTLRHFRKIQNLFEDLSQLCADLGGRIQLTKNVACRPQDFFRMYGPAAQSLLEIKMQVDPHSVLRNSFFDRLFADPRFQAQTQARPDSESSMRESG